MDSSWVMRWEGIHPDQAQREESLTALADGALGWRGNIEEGCEDGYPQTRGCYLNGFFEQEPIRYGEIAYGYARNSQTMLNVTDSQRIDLAADGEALRYGPGRVRHTVRELDLRAGLVRRETVYAVPGGQLRLTARRLVSLTRPGTAAIRWQLEADTDCRIALRAVLDGAVTNRQVTDDPRIGSGLRGQALSRPEARRDGALLALQQHTRNSGLSLCCAMAAQLCTPHGAQLPGEHWAEAQAEGLAWDFTLKKGERITLTKVIVCLWDASARRDSLWEEVLGRVRGAASAGFNALAQEQEEHLAAFWNRAGLVIEGNDTLLRGLRFNLFHVYQSAGRSGKVNIAAKGLTGEGYEGHYFWDTETYILPFLDSAAPGIARQLLAWRCGILPLARDRAREMGYVQGALYPWRTIDGHETSAYYPAGTAQIHINADIAMAIRRYVWMTGDTDFLTHKAAEALCEICRYYVRYGFFDPEKGGDFCLNGVTGPDEYNAIVNNNTYTNLMAAETLAWTADVVEEMAQSDPAAFARLRDAIALAEDEIRQWRHAAERIHVPRQQGTDLIWQDDAFASRVPWPLSSIPKDHFPLLLHYHPLEIYRHRVCKQADLVLAMLLLPDRFTEAEKRAAFDYYDPVTTHDSSLSHAAFSALAGRVGRTELMFRYFMDSALLDLEDTHGNTSDGLHMANMAGSWFSLVIGFGGFEPHREGFTLRPMLPPEIRSYAFRLQFQGALFEVRVDAAGARCVQLDGTPAQITARDGEITVHGAVCP